MSAAEVLLRSVPERKKAQACPPEKAHVFHTLHLGVSHRAVGVSSVLMTQQCVLHEVSETQTKQRYVWIGG